MQINPKISIITPVYNEEKNLTLFIDELLDVIKKINLEYEIILCMDPSTDKTEEMAIDFCNKNKRIKLIKFSRRFGQPAATMAGLKFSKGNYIVIIDSDLQDPPKLIKEMYDEILKGYDVVYAKRKSRAGETFLKKIVSKIGYKLINFFSDVDIPENVGDYRIMTRKVVNELILLTETHGFLRGLVAYVGFRQTFISYDRDRRFFGDGKYNKYTGSFKIGLNGLIGFSSKPLQFMSLIGLFFSFISFLIGSIYLAQKLMGYDFTPGLPTTVLVITFFSGINLIGLGIIGEYIARIYDEVKKRPPYIVDKTFNMND
jgi:polyisoprenyl-phosphate glycosyltransferase